ncbi:hypothetical protein [Acinetobacter baumannii]|uniref:hypothetical protein n=1 Tax=Acinetobacter baumannii TaxID=470 RepID=UPI001FF6892F|nr:hypothetical protein [Acinetobacter baumannii]MCJ8917265.1 hypothetical protein [Acinetobacter baumannii]MCJ8979618.1 hypothetical protein [Acinetobacter baumannii]MCJ9283405.1 hypothetical protein [Acinetobacter baumannii]MCJ9316109.1 hypothetical protein [Acinetobacter baumannii]
MAIDPSIITNATLQQQAQQNEIGKNLAGLTGALGQLVLGRKAQQMSQLATPQEQQAFANDSIFSPYLNRVLKAKQAESQKNAIDLLKAQAEIGKTNSEATKNNAQAGGFTLDNSQKKFGALQGAFQQAALTGDKGAVLLTLDALQRTGTITPEDYAHNFKIVSAMSPEEIKQYATGSGLLNKDLAPYLSQTKNNEADNATSVANNIRTTDASRYATDTAAATADKNRIQDKILEEQKLAMERGEFETMTGTDGKAYAVYKDGRVEPLLLKSGEAFTPQPKGTNKETQLQMIKRKESAQNHVSASAQAASGATLAANIANRYVQGGYNPAKFALESKIPGTEAYGIAKDLESLKSNAFLSRADQMRGLGALTETEGARLISSVSPLDPMQSSEKFLTDLKNVANTFRDISKSNRDKAQLYANPNGNITNPTVAPAESTEQNVTIPKGAYMTLSDVKASAKNAGISVEDAIQRLQSKGVTIR